jgi:tetratricopeptide repeat protein
LARPSLFAAPAGGLPPRLRGRDGLLERLSALVWAPDGRTHVLAGPGGTGKTAIALWVAREAARRGVPVWWVPAADPRTLPASLLDLAADLGGRPGEVAQAGAGQRDAADVLWERLEQRTPWLLVFDGAPGGPGGPGGPGALAGWLRRTHLGLIVVTSRNADRLTWGRHVEVHAVGPLDPAAGGQVLADLAPRGGSAADAAALSEQAGGLPLALRLAGKLIAAGAADGESVGGYALALDEHAGGAPVHGAPVRGRAGGHGRSVVADARDLALEALAAGGRPQARALLRVLCCLAPSVLIPAALLDASVLGGVCDDDAALAKEGLRALSRVGLITSSDAGVTVHGLVSESSRVYTGDAARAGAVAVAVLAAAAGRLDPREPADWPAWAALAPHAGAANAYLGGMLGQSDLAALAGVTGATALAFLHRGHAAAAAELAADALRHAGRLGSDHEAVLALRATAARARPLEGLTAGAEQEMLDLLAAQVRVLGAEHPDTLGTGHQVARLLARQGHYEQAERRLRDLRGDYARTLGPDHPDTLTAWHDFGLVLAQRGDYAQAEREFTGLLAARARVLGPEHRDTRVTRRWLAHVTATDTKLRSG